MKTAMLLLALAFGFTACSASTDELLPTQDDNSIGNSHTYNSLISKTTAYPASYAEELEHKGRVERIDYATRDYAEGTGRSRTNMAYVYLPYGYDDNDDVRYNVIYLVHGHYGTASTTFEAEGGLQRKVLDHMMENGDCARLSLCRQVTTMGSLLPTMWMPTLIAALCQ